tara:strand:- start:2040 stop:2819 length:780 start_codon:yes stop_codon:yes gene_type:complete
MQVFHEKAVCGDDFKNTFFIFIESLAMSEAIDKLSIKNWSLDDRPREKLLQKGRTALSNSELLAILLGSGSRDESAVALGQRILASVNNNLNELGKQEINKLMKFKGIGEAKAITIAAALELGRRRRAEEAMERKKISSSRTAYDILQPIIGDLPHEEFWIIYLNHANKVLNLGQVSRGGMTSTIVDVRLIMRRALEEGATAIVLAHNHPSGTLKPSQDDIKITTKVKKAANSLDIRVLDHLIVTEKSYFSFADEALIQ